MGELISFQAAREKQRPKAPSNVDALYWALKSSGWGQMLIDMVIAAAAAEHSGSVCSHKEEKHG